MFRGAGTSSLLTAQFCGRCPRAIAIFGRFKSSMAFVMDSGRRNSGAKPDIATTSALWSRQLATAEGHRLPQCVSDSSGRSSAASKLPARWMARMFRANFLRSSCELRLGRRHLGRTMWVATGQAFAERRPGLPVEILQGHPPPSSGRRLKEPPSESLAAYDPAGGANGFRTRDVSRTYPSCRSSVNRIQQALA